MLSENIRKRTPQYGEVSVEASPFFLMRSDATKNSPPRNKSGWEAPTQSYISLMILYLEVRGKAGEAYEH